MSNSEAAPFILADDLTLSLGGRVILDHIGLAIGQGEFVALLGPNGAGKTTFLRALLGIVRPQTGRLMIDGRPAHKGNRLIGYMPQTRAGLGDIRLSCRAFLASLGAAPASVASALRLVQADILADRRLNQLSGGERQRLLLAQALIGQPRLLLLDEPLIYLDPTRQNQMIALIKHIQLQTGATVIFCAHEINPLLSVTDRVLYLGDRQAALGTIDQVITPATLSRLYGAPVDVVRTGGHIFVMGGDAHMEGSAHLHHHDHPH